MRKNAKIKKKVNLVFLNRDKLCIFIFQFFQFFSIYKIGRFQLILAFNLTFFLLIKVIHLLHRTQHTIYRGIQNARILCKDTECIMLHRKNATIITMAQILDGNTGHVAHIWSKTGLA